MKSQFELQFLQRQNFAAVLALCKEQVHLVPFLVILSDCAETEGI